jgi:hypothetical protein
MLAIEGEAPVRPDPAIGELAALLHERLIGELTIQREADAEDWRALLVLLARGSEDLLAEGGIGSAWAGSGRSHFEIREIDYAEVLRERAGGESDRSAPRLWRTGGAARTGIDAQRRRPAGTTPMPCCSAR